MDATATELLKLSEAARLAGVSRSTLNAAAMAEQIVFVETPLGRLFATEDVMVWAAERQERERVAA